MVESGNYPNSESDDPQALSPQAGDDHGDQNPYQDAPYQDAQDSYEHDHAEAVASAVEADADPNADDDDDDELEAETSSEPTGGALAKVLAVAGSAGSWGVTAASFVTVHGAGLIYNYPRAALASGLSVVVLAGVLVVRPSKETPIAQVPSPGNSAPPNGAKSNPEQKDAKAKADQKPEPPASASAINKPAPAPDLVADQHDPDPAPAPELTANEYPTNDALRLTGGESDDDLPALPALDARTSSPEGEPYKPAPKPVLALASANLKLGEGPEEAAPAPAPEPSSLPGEPKPAAEPPHEPAPALAPEPTPVQKPAEPAPAPAPEPTPVQKPAAPTPAPAPTPGDGHGLLETPSLSNDKPAPAPVSSPVAMPPVATPGDGHGLLEMPSLNNDKPAPTPVPATAPVSAPALSVSAPKVEAGMAGLSAGFGAAVGAMTGAAIGDRGDSKAGAEPAQAAPLVEPHALDSPPAAPVEPLHNLDQAPLPADEPPTMPIPTPTRPASGDLPMLRAVPESAAERIAPTSPTPSPEPSPTSTPKPKPSPTGVAIPEDWEPIKRSGAVVLLDLDRGGPDLDDEDGLEPRNIGPNTDPDAHADKSMNFEVHEPIRIGDEPAKAAPAAVDQGKMDTVLHKVESGENFWTIARTYYNSGRYYRALGKANADKFKRLEDLYVGALIRIPPPEDLDPAYIDAPTARSARNRDPAEPELASREPTTTAPAVAGVAPIRRSSRADVELNLPISDPATERASDQGLRDEPEIASRNIATRPIHKVRLHETLRTIARDRLGDARRADEILDLNRDTIDDPSRLIVGQILDLPEDASGLRTKDSR